MRFSTEIVVDLATQSELLRARPNGVIETAHERLVQVALRPFPKLVSLPEIAVWGRLRHRFVRGDRCRLYYNQPRRHRNFLALKYVVSSADTSLATFRLALTVLDEIARIKGVDALLCDVANLRISDRLMARWGWTPHCPHPWHRHFIKRFYGEYPTPPAGLYDAVLTDVRPDTSAPVRPRESVGV